MWGTDGDSSGDNGILGRRDPITGTEQIGDIIAIVQDSSFWVSCQDSPEADSHLFALIDSEGKPWAFLLVTLRMILVSSRWRRTNSHSPPGVYYLNGRQLPRAAGPTWLWMLERKVDPVPREWVGCLITPLLIRMHHLRGLVGGFWPEQI